MTTSHEQNYRLTEESPRVTVVLKTAEPYGAYVPYWNGEDTQELERRTR